MVRKRSYIKTGGTDTSVKNENEEIVYEYNNTAIFWANEKPADIESAGVFLFFNPYFPSTAAHRAAPWFGSQSHSTAYPS